MSEIRKEQLCSQGHNNFTSQPSSGKRGQHYKDSEDPKSSLRLRAPWRGKHGLVPRWRRGAKLPSIRHGREPRIGWWFSSRFDHGRSYVLVHPREPRFCPIGRRIWRADRAGHRISRCLCQDRQEFSDVSATAPVAARRNVMAISVKHGFSLLKRSVPYVRWSCVNIHS